MKIIHVHGEDYCVCNFEEHEMTAKEAYDKAISNGGSFINEDDESYFEVNSYEFDGEVNKKFIAFIRNEIQDYDEAKSNSFFIIEEE